MAVVSAGSLCAGPTDLPTGVNRQYNVVEIADDCSSVRVHVREMAISTVFAPSLRVEFGGKSHVDIDLGAPTHMLPPERAREDARIIEAEEALAANDPRHSVNLLETANAVPGTYARTLLVRALSAEGDFERTVRLLAPPQSIDELVLVVSSYVRLAQFDAAGQALDRHASALGMDANTLRELRGHVSAKRSMA
jgi:hypothetical protein